MVMVRIEITINIIMLITILTGNECAHGFMSYCPAIHVY